MYASDWIRMLDLNKIDLYPLQFANCERLRNNDAVYIFDEVGGGKTISSGIMALDYLDRNPNDKVLVITTNSLYRYCPAFQGGQFKNDWMSKLPFVETNLDKNIIIVNNHASKFKSPASYGLVIIDEAQLFLNKSSLRFEMLTQNICAKKIVFLTATPIKEGVQDLNTYLEIAKKVLGKRVSHEWIADINTTNKDAKDVICSGFDAKSPVTRYFKDTIMALNVRGYKKNQAKRLLPHLWEYSGINEKDSLMLCNINEIYSKDSNSRFVIFTRFVEKEAIKIGKYFEDNGYAPFDNNINALKTCYIVTGRNGDELSRFSGKTNLPTILILTYQIAEQGINLPGFNYVINYHISAYPSALEQRFGRIDRMGMSGSVYPEINVCYLICKDRFDSNTSNFYEAVSTYIYSLLSYLPSKNMLLSKKIIDQYIQKKSLVEEYIGKILRLCDNSEEIEKIISYFRDTSNIENSLKAETALKNETPITVPGIGFGEESELLEFCLSHEIIFDCDNNEIEIEKNLILAIRAACNELKRHFSFNAAQFNQIEFQTMINAMQDKIFYCKFEWTALSSIDSIDFKNGIGYIDAITESAKFISENELYNSYREIFEKCVKIPQLFEQCKPRLNKFFEDKFIDNDLNSIFPVLGYKHLLEKLHLLEKFDFSVKDSSLLLKNIDSLINTLPFFKMCLKFRANLHSLAYCNDGTYRIHYDFNPFVCAMGRLSDMQLEVSDKFKEEYFNGYIRFSGYSLFFTKFFYIDMSTDKVVIASNWYKLAYHYSRKEEFSKCIEGGFLEGGGYAVSTVKRVESKYRELEDILKRIAILESSNKQTSSDCSLGDDERVSLYRQRDMANQALEKIKKCNSLFHDFVFTEKGNLRKWIKWSSLRTNYYKHSVYINDYWTQGIYSELFDY
ncbi:MAG: hypothetical protein LBT43_13305, partial [Prevotella sp.]|nr:hypothetical protein [Prevotella sp.]